jgi:pimeloyl-ACP methyl ester carboxylesterase
MRRSLIAAAILLLIAAVIASLELVEPQPPRDAVAAAERELGIELEASRVDVGDVELFVVQAGPPDGEPVLLLHGFPEFWYAWRGPMARLAARGYRVIVPDQRGYAGSDKPAAVEAYNVERLAGDAAGLIAALGYESALVAAHDWGGAVAWELALRHRDRVRRLAVIGMPHPRAVLAIQQDGDSDDDGVAWYVVAFQLPWLPERVARLGNWRFLADALRNTSRPDTFSEKTLDLFRSAWDRDGAMTGMINWYRAAFRYPPSEPADWQVRARTLVILAPGDVFISSVMTRRSLDWIDDGRLVELERGTHWVNQEDPDAIAALLGEFFAAP